MFKKVANYVSAHGAPLAGAAAGVALVGLLGYVMLSGSFGLDFFDEMAWGKNVYENNQAFNSVSYQVGEVDESDNRIHDDEDDNEGLSESMDDELAGGEDAAGDASASLAGNTVQTDNSTRVGSNTTVVDDPAGGSGAVQSGQGQGNGEGEGNSGGSGGAGEGDEGDTPGGPGPGDDPSGPGGPSGPGEGDTPSGNEPPPLTDNQKEQLSAREDYVDENGTLVGLEVQVPSFWSFAIGDSYNDRGVTVTAVYKRPDGTEARVVVPYGGENGYKAFLSPTWKSGQHDATFVYGGISTSKPFTIMGKRFNVAFGAWDGKKYYAPKCPGPFLKEPFLSAADDIQEKAIPHDVVGGFFTDLSDAQRFMITVLGRQDVNQQFVNSGDKNFGSVMFLESALEENFDGTLKEMVAGFRFIDSSEDESPFIYAHSAEDGQSISQSVLSIVKAVPENFSIRRVEGTQEDRFLGDQILVAYTGNESQLEIPMGVTKVALEEENDKVTSLVIPESVIDVDFASVTRCFPSLESVCVTGNTQTFGSLFGALYTADGTRLLYVPPKHAAMNNDENALYALVKTIASGAFSECDMKEVVVPASVTMLEEDCFKDAKIESLCFEGKAPVEGVASSGYGGNIFVSASPYDTLCKQWVASLGATDAMKVGVRGVESEDGSGTDAVEPGTYVYDAAHDIVVADRDRTVLAGIPPQASKTYLMPEVASITAVGAGAFATASNVREVVVSNNIREFRKDSLADLGKIERITLSGDHVASIDKEAFGAQGVADIEVHVPNNLYEQYLKSWGAVLGEDAAKKLLVPSEGVFVRVDGARYQVLDESAPDTSQLRLVEVQDEGQTFFEPSARTVEIADGAFSACEVLEIVHIPESVRTVGKDAFAGCGRLESVLVSGSLDGAFDVGSATLYKPAANVAYDYDARVGTIYENRSNGELVLVNVPTDTTSLTVRKGTTHLGDNALKGCSLIKDARELASPDIEGALDFASPETLVSIGAHCFEDCSSLLQIDFTKFAALKQVGESAFSNCAALQIALLSDSVADMGEGAFSDCSSLVWFKAGGLSELRARSFAQCVALQVIEASRVTVVGDECFYHCERLELIEDAIKVGTQPGEGEASGSGSKEGAGAEEDAEEEYADSLNVDELTWVGDRAFAYCLSFGQNQHRTLNMKSLEHIGIQAFMGCPALNEVTLPASLTELGEEAFRDCLSLDTVNAQGSLDTIGRYCFYGCVSLMHLNVSDSQKGALEVIGACAFSNCDALERLDLSDYSKLSYVGNRAFEGCDGLLRITLPRSLTEVSDRCFADCPDLSIVELSSETPTALGSSVFGAAAPEYLSIWVPNQQAYQKYLKAYEPKLDPEYGEGYALSVLALHSDTVERLRGITYEAKDEGWVITDALESVSGPVMIADSVAAIGPEAFKGCDKIESIQYEFGASISLGDRAFEGCTGLKSVQLNGTVPEWGDSVFAHCPNLESVRIGGSEEGDYIARVGSRAFENCPALSSVGFFSPVGSIGESAFRLCTSLRGIAVADSFKLKLKNVGDCAFEGAGLSSYPFSTSYTSLETIGREAFADCDSLTNGYIPKNVKTLGEACFSGCDNLQTVSIYGGLAEIPKDCFKNCPKLLRTGGTAAALKGLKRVGESAFEGCISLEITSSWSLDKYVNLEYIGDNAFKDAITHTQVGAGKPRLDAITLAPTLTHIGAHAFDGCIGLAKVTLQSNPEIEDGAFANMRDGFVLEKPGEEQPANAAAEDAAAVSEEPRAASAAPGASEAGENAGDNGETEVAAAVNAAAADEGVGVAGKKETDPSTAMNPKGEPA